MTETLCECESITDDRPLRQGDVFEWREPEPGPWKRFGIILTANCDIAHDKHGGSLSYAPILRVTEYLRLFYLPERINKVAQPLSEELVATMRRHQKENLPDYPEPISPQAAIEWVMSEDPIRLADQLRIQEKKDKDKFIALAKAYVGAMRTFDAGEFDPMFEALCRLRTKNEQDAPKVREKAREDLVSAVERLPGDAFFLSSLSPQHPGGYVVYLRLVREIGKSQVAIRYSELRDSSVKARRISRLQSPYVFRLTQQLSEVFSAIGLPSEYEENRRAAVTQMLATKNQTPKKTD